MATAQLCSFSNALAAVDEDVDLLCELADIVNVDMPQLYSEMEKARRTDDRLGLSQVVHKIRGAVAVFRAFELSDELSALEISAMFAPWPAIDHACRVTGEQLAVLSNELLDFAQSNRKGLGCEGQRRADLIRVRRI